MGYLSKNKFLKPTITLISGTVLSQVFLFLVTPILSRIYSVEDFGYLSIFIGISSFLSVISGGKYELALGIPSNNKSAKRIYNLTINIVFYFFIFYVFVSFLFYFLYLPEILILFIPFYVFLVAVYSLQNYWFQRDKKYKDISLILLMQTLSNIFWGLVLGWFNVKYGLIYSSLLSFLLPICYMMYLDKRFFEVSFLKKYHIVLAKKYRYFPRYVVISDLFMTASQQLLPILFALMYNATVVGLFSMANRLVRIPNIVITSAITNVFRNNAIDAIRISGNCRDLYVSTFKKLVLVGFSVYLLIFLLAPTLFVLILGDKWMSAGYFCSILSILLMVEFCSVPLNSIFALINKQRVLMVIQVSNFVLGFLVLFFLHFIFHDPLYSLLGFVINSILFNIICLFFSYKFSSGM